MLTDAPPRADPLRREFLASDALLTLALPAAAPCRLAGRAVEAALAADSQPDVLRSCLTLAALAADAHGVRPPVLRVLAARPVRTRRDGGGYELFGDYDPQTTLIRVWMRTAVRRQVTTYGTFLSTLCHELCHHLDVQRLGFPSTPHTRGFYARVGCLYHHARGTPALPLRWIDRGEGRWRVDWAALRAHGRQPQANDSGPGTPRPSSRPG